MLRLLVALSLLGACAAFAPATPALQLSKVAASSRVDGLAMMAAKKPVKKVAKKAAPKKAAPKKVVAKKAAPKPVARKAAPAPKAAPPAKRKVIRSRIGKSPVAKGGIFPWITNTPGTYGRPLTLSSVDFTSDASDAWIGWGFMPKSVKASLYPKGYKGMLNK